MENRDSRGLVGSRGCIEPTPSGLVPGGTTLSRNSPRLSRAGSAPTLATVSVISQALGTPWTASRLRPLVGRKWGKKLASRFVCFVCGAWGYMETARVQWHEERQRQA